jgi:hypothetical protein
MPKKHSQSRVVENKGLAALQHYCANHDPQLTWRPVGNDDIGCDGEIELYDDDGYPIAEIIKVQIKSTEEAGSYIRNWNALNGTFTFYAERDHVEYWQKLQNDVLLVIFDNRGQVGRLFAKKIENIDLRNIGTKSVPIAFDQNLDQLDLEQTDFLKRFSRKYNAPTRPVLRPVLTGTETLYSNLLRVSFPTNKIYIAPLNFDRETVIQASWQTDNPIKHNATARSVLWTALKQKNLRFSSDWIVHKNQLITCHDLNDKKIALSEVVEAPIDELAPSEFFTVSDDYKNLFRHLVKQSVQQMLYTREYEWRADEELFRFIAPAILKDKLKVKRTWKAPTKATRTLFKSTYYEKFGVHYCQHFAFSVDITNFQDEWYLCINPTWTVSINGKQKSLSSEKNVKALKRLERNKSVFNHLRYVTYQFEHSDLYTPKYRFLEFHGLETCTTELLIDDQEWLKDEAQDDVRAFQDIEDRPEDNNEKLLF